MRSVEGIVLLRHIPKVMASLNCRSNSTRGGSQLWSFANRRRASPAQAKRNEVRYSILNELRADRGPWRSIQNGAARRQRAFDSIAGWDQSQ